MPKKQQSLTLEATPPPVPSDAVSADGSVSLRRELVHVDDIAPNPFQPRENFDEAYIEGLAVSIQENGLLQEPQVRPATGDHGKPWELLFGENRQRAIKLLVSRGQHDGVIEVKVRQANDLKAMLLGIIENVKRHDLNVVEEATAYDRLTKMGLTHADIGTQVGFSDSTIASKLRLLTLPALMQQGLRDDDLSADHGYALLMLPSSKEQNEWGLKALESHWSARVLHSLIKEHLDAEHKRLNPPLFPAAPTPKPVKSSAPKTLGTATQSGTETQSSTDTEKPTTETTDPPVPSEASTPASVEESSSNPSAKEKSPDEDTASPDPTPAATPTDVPAPPAEIPAPAPIPSGTMVMAPVPGSEAIWLKQHGLTTGVALAHLRRFYTICQAAPNLGRILEMDGLGGALDYLETLHTGDTN